MFLEQFTIEILTGTALFIAGVFLAKPITKRVEQWKRAVILRKHKSFQVKIFFILCPFSSEQLKRVLLRQNQIQRIFEIEIVEWESWAGRYSSENALSGFHTDSRLEFSNRFNEEMQKYNDEKKVTGNRLINIAITCLPFPKNYYTWNTRNRRGIVVGIQSLHHLFKDEPQTVNMIILRIVQRMLIYSLNIDGLIAHEITRGCLFDLTRKLTDIQYSTEKTYICDQCRKVVLEKRGLTMLEEIEAWIAG